MKKYNNKNIIHYTVGLNKNRGGGMTKYVDDLAAFQSKSNNVFILYPGQFGFIDRKVRIKKEKNKENIQIYSIKNPLSLPLMFGLRDMDYIYKKSDINLWKEFFINNKIDIVHLHTIMGLYSEFIDAANELNIPILYTTHDYFGLCSKQTFVFDGKICDKWKNCENCSKCNSTAFSKMKIKIIHSKLFCSLRRFNFFKKLKSIQKRKIDNDKSYNLKRELTYDADYYKKLREKMISSIKKIDYLHFNSSVSKMVFKMLIPNIEGKVINITHCDIKNNRKLKKFDSKKLRVTYLGPAIELKGFYDIIYSIDAIYKYNKNIVLNIYSYTEIERPYINKVETGYRYDELGNIFDKTDILIAPSKCYETFGFTICEALSFGVPVIVSNYVGAKDLVDEEKNGFIIHNNQIASVLLDLINNREKLIEMNNYICKSNFYSFENHVDAIYDLYSYLAKKKQKEV